MKTTIVPGRQRLAALFVFLIAFLAVSAPRWTRALFTTAALLVAFSLRAAPAHAQTKILVNDANSCDAAFAGDTWDDGARQCTVRVESEILPGTIVTIGHDVTLRVEQYVKVRGKLVNEGTIDIVWELEILGGMSIGTAEIENKGTINILANGVLDNQGANPLDSPGTTLLVNQTNGRINVHDRGDLENGGTFLVRTSDRTIRNWGSIQVNDGGDFLVGDGDVFNHGVLTIFGYMATDKGIENLSPNGYITVAPGGEWRAFKDAGTFNYGTIDNRGEINFSRFWLTDIGGTLVNHGVVINRAGAKLWLEGSHIQNHGDFDNFGFVDVSDSGILFFNLQGVFTNLAGAEVFSDGEIYIEDGEIQNDGAVFYGCHARFNQGSLPVWDLFGNSLENVCGLVLVPPEQQLTGVGDQAISLIARDFRGRSLRYTLLSWPATGTMSGNFQQIFGFGFFNSPTAWTPPSGFMGGRVGANGFAYWHSMGFPITLTIDVMRPNLFRPVANPQSLTTPVGVPTPILLTGSDADGDPLRFFVVSTPLHGQLSGEPPNLAYMPNAGFSGRDEVSFVVCDSFLCSDPAVVAVHVTGAAPTVTTLTSTPNPSSLGQAVTLKAIVSNAPGFEITGTVTFYDGSAPLGEVAFVVGGPPGSATFVTTDLGRGPRSLKAVYSGDANHAASTSSPLAHAVAEAGSRPASVAIAEFNGDGQQDIAVANEGSNTVTALTGNGDGTFDRTRSYAVGTNPVFVGAGDLNMDGHADLAVANFSSHNVSVLVGNGDGTFNPSVNYSAGSFPNSVALADFDGDGYTDLGVAVSHVSQGVRVGVGVLLGNGDGTFGPAVHYAAGIGSRSISIGDFNDDGRADLAVANDGSESRNVSVLLGNGDGTFQAPLNFGNFFRPRSLAVADFDRDGRDDLVVITGSSGGDDETEIDVFLGNGDGTFLAAGSYDAGALPLSVAVGDFNDDDAADVVAANNASNSVSVLLGDGEGTFQAPVNHAVGQGPQSVATGDLNADGASDLVTANVVSNDVTVLLGTSIRPDLTITKTHIGHFRQGQAGASYAIGVTNSGHGPTTAFVTVIDTLPPGLNAMDMGGDGWSCVLAALTCERGDVLEPGASYPAVVLTVDVADDAPAGVTNTVTVSGGGEARTTNNTATDQTAIVQKPTLTMIAANAERLYGEANAAFSGFILGIQNNDNITATYASTVTPGDPVGTYDIVPTLVDPDGKLGGYTVVVVNGVLTVTPAPLIVVADDASKQYGDSFPSFTASYVGFVGGDGPSSLGGALDFTVPPTAHDVGTYPVVPFGLTSANYAITFVPGTLTIHEALLLVVANDVSRSYWDPDPMLTGAIGGVIAGDTITAIFSTATTPTTPAGIHAAAIVPHLVDPGNRLPNYIVTSVNGTFTIVNPLPVLEHLGVNSMVKVDPEETNPILLEMHGTNFVPQSTARWNGEGLATTFLTPELLVASVPPASLESRGVAYVTVFGPTDGGGGGESALKEFFVTDSPAPVLDAATSTVDSGALMVTTGGAGPGTLGSVTAEGLATGPATATVAHYAQNPGGPATFNTGAQYFDVFVAPDSDLTTLTITNCAPGPEPVNLVYWSNDMTWQLASHQSFNPVTNCVTVTVTDQAPPDATSPTLEQLVGTYFATSVDFAPPTTTATARSGSESGPPYEFGTWTNQPVFVTLTAGEEPGGSGVAQLTYQITGAGAMPTTPSATGVATFPIAAEGSTTITFSATDRAGNHLEEPQTTQVLIDRTGPIVTAEANPSELWPPNGKLVPVTISGTISDDGSAIGSATYQVSDSNGEVQLGGVVIVDTDGAYMFTVMLPARRSGTDKDGRQFVITILATDNAGNAHATSADVVVPHDMGKMIRRRRRLDDHLLQWFRQQVHAAGGGSYQTLINARLREYVDTKGEPLEATLRRVLREELPRDLKRPASR